MKNKIFKSLFLLVVFCLPIFMMVGCDEPDDVPYIEVSGVVTTYNLNDELNLLNAEGRYFEDSDDDDPDIFAVTRLMVSNFSTNQTGNFTMRITYKGCVLLLDYKVNGTQGGGNAGSGTGSATTNTPTTKAEIHERFSLLYNSSKYIFTLANGVGVGIQYYVDGVVQPGGYTFHKNRETSYMFLGIVETWRCYENGVIVEYKKDNDQYIKDLSVEQSLIPETFMNAVFTLRITQPNLPYDVLTYEYSKTGNVETITLNSGTAIQTYIFTDMCLSEVRKITGSEEARIFIEYSSGDFTVPGPPQVDFEVVE